MMTREDFETAVRKFAESSGLDSEVIGQALAAIADDYFATE